MANQPVVFGRRGARKDSRSTSRPPTPGAEPGKPPVDEQARARVLTMMVMIPAAIGAIMLMAFMINHGSVSSGTPGAVAANSGNGCRSKAAAGTIFDIDWCQAGAAAVRGAIGGIGAGAARR